MKKILYLDCGMGAAGDMLAGALLELLPQPDEFLKEINGLGMPGVNIKKETCAKCGIKGTHFSVSVNGKEESEDMYGHEHGHGHTHHHSSMRDIEQIITGLPVPESVKDSAVSVYRLIAEAESHVHGVPVTDIHFHEVGTMDAVADIVSVCLLMERLSPDEVIASPVHAGCGQVQCAHGMLPVPAPATAFLLRGIPVYGGQIKGELCTPTGAALLKHFVDRFGDMPVMRTERIGYGMGKKDFAAANCLRALLGGCEEGQETVTELSCNLDDMSPEAVGFAVERLTEAGALEVYTVPAGMKKNRPGILFCVMCKNEDRDRMLELIFLHTTTLGVREYVSRRYTLDRRMETVRSSFGDVRRKVSAGYGVVRGKYEYDDLARIARERGMAISEVRKAVDLAFDYL